VALTQQEQLVEQIHARRTSAQLTTELTTLNSEIQRATDELNHLNDHKSNGRKEFLALQATQGLRKQNNVNYSIAKS